MMSEKEVTRSEPLTIDELKENLAVSLRKLYAVTSSATFHGVNISTFTDVDDVEHDSFIADRIFTLMHTREDNGIFRLRMEFWEGFADPSISKHMENLLDEVLDYKEILSRIKGVIEDEILWASNVSIVLNRAKQRADMIEEKEESEK